MLMSGERVWGGGGVRGVKLEGKKKSELLLTENPSCGIIQHTDTVREAGETDLTTSASVGLLSAS